MLRFKPAFSLSSFASSRGSLVPLHFLPLKCYHLLIWGCWYIFQQSWFQLVISPAQHFTWCTLHIIWISRVTIYSLDVLLFNLEPVCCSMSDYNCCFLMCIQTSQEAGNVVSYSHLLKNFPVCCDLHSQRFWCSQYGRSKYFFGILLPFLWSDECWQLDLWFLPSSKSSLNIWKF